VCERERESKIATDRARPCQYIKWNHDSPETTVVCILRTHIYNKHYWQQRKKRETLNYYRHAQTATATATIENRIDTLCDSTMVRV